MGAPTLVASACGRTDLDAFRLQHDADTDVRELREVGTDAREVGAADTTVREAAAHDTSMHDAISVVDAAADAFDATPDASPDAALDASEDVEAGCGNHRRDGLEGCDDGNTVSGDGCRADCVVEGATVPIFKDFAGTGIGVFAMAATTSGLLYFADFSSPNHVHRLSTDGTLTTNVVPNMRTTYPSYTLVAVGEDLVVGGTFETGGRSSEIYGWFAQSQTTTTLYSALTPNGLVSHAAVDVGLTKIIYGDQMGGVKRVTSTSETTPYGSLGSPFIFGRPNGGLATVVYPNVLYTDDGNGVFSVRYTYGVSQPDDVWWMLATDGEDTIYVTCLERIAYSLSASCPSGSVWAVDAAGHARVFVDNFRPVMRLAWDPSSNELILLATQGGSILEPRILRVPLAR